MSKFADKQFWIDTLDRTISSFAQGFLASASLETSGILDIEWVGVLSLAGSFALASFVQAIAFRGNSDARTDIEA